MKRKVLILVMLTLIAVMLLSACGKKDDGKFRVGLEAGYAPFNWTQ